MHLIKINFQVLLMENQSKTRKKYQHHLLIDKHLLYMKMISQKPTIQTSHTCLQEKMFNEIKEIPKTFKIEKADGSTICLSGIGNIALDINIYGKSVKKSDFRWKNNRKGMSSCICQVVFTDSNRMDTNRKMIGTVFKNHHSLYYLGTSLSLSK